MRLCTVQYFIVPPDSLRLTSFPDRHGEEWDQLAVYGASCTRRRRNLHGCSGDQCDKPRPWKLFPRPEGLQISSLIDPFFDPFPNPFRVLVPSGTTLILAWNWYSSQRTASQPLSVFRASNLLWSKMLFTAMLSCYPLNRTPFSNLVHMHKCLVPRPKTTVIDLGTRLVHTWNRTSSEHGWYGLFPWYQKAHWHHAVKAHAFREVFF